MNRPSKFCPFPRNCLTFSCCMSNQLGCGTPNHSFATCPANSIVGPNPSGLSYIIIRAAYRQHESHLGFYLFVLMCRQVYSIPGEHVSRTAILSAPARGGSNKVFGKLFTRLFDRFLVFRRFVSTARIPSCRVNHSHRYLLHDSASESPSLHDDHQETCILSSQSMSSILIIVICLCMIVVDSMIDAMIYSGMIDLSRSYERLSSLFSNLFIMFVIYF